MNLSSSLSATWYSIPECHLAQPHLNAWYQKFYSGPSEQRAPTNVLCPSGVSPCVMSRTSKAQHGLCLPGGLKLRAPGHTWVRQPVSILLIAIYREREKLVCICLGGIYGALDLHCTVPWETLASSGADRVGSGASDGTGAGQTLLLRGLSGIFLSSSPKPGNMSGTAMPG